jgi:uncharacterized cupin superfamily protein
MADSRNAAGDDGVFRPFHSDDVCWEDFTHGERFGARMKQLGEFGGGSHLGVCLEELAPGRQVCPAHYHLLEEEHLYVLQGEMTLRLGAERHHLRAGSYACFPAGQQAAHALINDSDAVCRYLIIGERNPHDVIVYPDSGRVSVRLTGEGYRKSATMDYWEGEEA